MLLVVVLKVSLFASASASTFGSPSPQEIEKLIANGNAKSVQQLLALSKSADAAMLATVSRGLTRIAEEKLLTNQHKEARALANHIWLSSSPRDAREKAWRILWLTEPPHEVLAKGQRMQFVSRGGRDHDRFRSWLETEFVRKHDWILGFQVTYELEAVDEKKFDEVARITFVVDRIARKEELLRFIINSRSTYSTRGWMLLEAKPISQMR